MKTYIMLFRGINVGGRNILPMKELISLLDKNGYKNVKTYIQSGNVALQSTKKPGTDISNAIESKFGFKPEVIVLEKSEYETVIRNNPFQSNENKSVHLYFAGKKLKPDLDRLDNLSSNTERYEIRGRVLYLLAPEGIGRSKLVSNIDACLGVSVTGRNLKTITKLKELTDVL